MIVDVKLAVSVRDQSFLNGSQLGVILSNRGPWTVSGDIFNSHSGRERYYWDPAIRSYVYN